MKLQKALEETGYKICEFEPDETTCDKCKQPNKQLYFISTNFFDSREGNYHCEDCVKQEAEMIEKLDEFYSKIDITTESGDM